MSPLEKIIKSVLRGMRNRKDISEDTLDYFLVNNPKLGRFHLLPKIHKRLHNIPGRPFISNSGYCTKICQVFSNMILNRLQKKLNHISRTPMAFYVN